MTTNTVTIRWVSAINGGRWFAYRHGQVVGTDQDLDALARRFPIHVIRRGQ